MQRTYLTLWKQYLAEQDLGAPPADPNQEKGLELKRWARKYVETHKLKVQSRKVIQQQDPETGSYSQVLETFSYGEGWKASFPESLTHQVEITILVDYEQPQNIVVTARVYGTGLRASVGDMVNSTIKAADWDASKQSTIEALLKPYVRK
jgi:hypothetical protein